MELILSIDLIRWIDANRSYRSRQAFIAKILRDSMNNSKADAFANTEKDILIKNEQTSNTALLKSTGNKD